MGWQKQGLIFDAAKDLGWQQPHAALPTAFHLKDDVYRVFFSGRDQSNRSQIGFFDITITDLGLPIIGCQTPLLKRGAIGRFDDSGAMCSWVVEQHDTLFLYYIGWNLSKTVPFRNAIGLAISHDRGDTFTRYSDGPVLDRGIHDPCFVASSCVLVENGVWRMWYLSCVRWVIEEGAPKHYYHIKYAESADGIHWNPERHTCIDFAAPDEYAISRPSVLKEGNIYKMWYSYRGQSYRIGYAESPDGISWVRKDREVGIDVSHTGWDSEMIEYPFVFDHKGQRYMLYNGNGYGRSGIGIASMRLIS